MKKSMLRVYEGGGGEPAPEERADPILEECIEDALGPYREMLSPAELLEHRRFLTLFIKTHPAAAAIYDRQRARNVGKASGDVLKDGWEHEGDADDVGSGAEGGRR